MSLISLLVLLLVVLSGPLLVAAVAGSCSGGHAAHRPPLPRGPSRQQRYPAVLPLLLMLLLLLLPLVSPSSLSF